MSCRCSCSDVDQGPKSELGRLLPTPDTTYFLAPCDHLQNCPTLLYLPYLVLCLVLICPSRQDERHVSIPANRQSCNPNHTPLPVNPLCLVVYDYKPFQSLRLFITNDHRHNDSKAKPHSRECAFRRSSSTAIICTIICPHCVAHACDFADRVSCLDRQGRPNDDFQPQEFYRQKSHRHLPIYCQRYDDLRLCIIALHARHTLEVRAILI